MLSTVLCFLFSGFFCSLVTAKDALNFTNSYDLLLNLNVVFISAVSRCLNTVLFYIKAAALG